MTPPTPLPSVKHPTSGGALYADLATREAAEMVSRYVESNPGVGAGRLIEGTRSIAEWQTWRAKRLLLIHGYIRNELRVEDTAHHYYSVYPYRIATDPDAEARPDLETRLAQLLPQMVDLLVAEGAITLELVGGLIRVGNVQSLFSGDQSKPSSS